MTKRATAAQKKTWKRLRIGKKDDCESVAKYHPFYQCTRRAGHEQPHVGHGGDPVGYAAWDDAGWYEERE